MYRVGNTSWLLLSIATLHAGLVSGNVSYILIWFIIVTSRKKKSNISTPSAAVIFRRKCQSLYFSERGETF